MIIGGKRNCGKTTNLIKLSSAYGIYIVCSTSERAQHIAKMAKSMEIEIPYPITVSELPLKSSFIDRVMVDDVEDVLAMFIGKPISIMGTSMEMLELEGEQNG